MNYQPYPYYPPSYGNTYLPRMEQAQPYTPPAQPMQPIGMIKGRPVTSEEEARGIPVDFDGSVMIFPDAGHGMVYTKQLNMQDGTATFRKYSLVQSPEPVTQEVPPVVQTPKEYAEKQEVDELRQMISALQSTVGAISRRSGKRKEVDAHEPDDADSGDA